MNLYILIFDNNFIFKNYLLTVIINILYIFIYIDIHMINNYYTFKSCIKKFKYHKI